LSATPSALTLTAAKFCCVKTSGCNIIRFVAYEANELFSSPSTWPSKCASMYRVFVAMTYSTKNFNILWNRSKFRMRSERLYVVPLQIFRSAATFTFTNRSHLLQHNLVSSTTSSKPTLPIWILVSFFRSAITLQRTKSHITFIVWRFLKRCSTVCTNTTIKFSSLTRRSPWTNNVSAFIRTGQRLSLSNMSVVANKRFTTMTNQNCGGRHG